MVLINASNNDVYSLFKSLADLIFGSRLLISNLLNSNEPHFEKE